MGTSRGELSTVLMPSVLCGRGRLHNRATQPCHAPVALFCPVVFNDPGSVVLAYASEWALPRAGVLVNRTPMRLQATLTYVGKVHQVTRNGLSVLT